MSTLPRLDDIDWSIVDQLQRDGRMSFSELARHVGLSQPATTERVRRLEDRGVITGFRAVVDPGKLGLPITVFIRVSPLGEQAWGAAHDAQRQPEVVECHRVTGEDSYILKAVVSSIEHLEALNDRLARFGRLTTSVVMSSPISGRVVTRGAVEAGGRLRSGGDTAP